MNGISNNMLFAHIHTDLTQYSYRRITAISATSMTFGPGYIVNITKTLVTESDSACVPHLIYGIK